MIKVGISHDRNWQEYRVYWIENGKYDEPKTVFISDSDENAAEEAVNTLLDILKRHPETQLTDAKYTLNLIAKYRPDALLEMTRRTLREQGLM